MTALSLTEFLLARIAEDEAAARDASGRNWTAYDPDENTERAGHFGCVAMGGMHPTAWPADAAHIARHDPARVLADCEAHNQVVRLYERVPQPNLYLVLSLLALPYAEHPDYNREWRR